MKLLLEKGADVESKDDDGQTPLSRAAIYGHSHEAVLKLLLESKYGVGQTPPSRAVRGGYKAVMKLLLKKGAEKLLH